MNTNNFMFSASSIKEFIQCGLKFKYGRIEKRERAETYSHHRWFGTLVHSTIYSAIATKNLDEKKYVLKSSTATAFPSKVFETLWQNKETDDPYLQHLLKELGEKPVGRFLPGKIKSLSAGQSQDKLEAGWKAEAKKMIKNGIKVLSEVPEIVELEKKLIFNILGRRFIGYSDVVAKDSEGKLCFYDLKTTWDKPTKLEDDFQFFAYALALKDTYKLDYWPKGYFVHLRSGAAIEYELTPQMFGKLISQTRNVFSDMEANVFPADLGGPLCPYCDFRLHCYKSEDKIWRRS